MDTNVTNIKSATVASYGGQSEDRDRSEWLDTIIFSDMTRGDSECHYEQWLLIISVERLVILICTIGLIFYLTRVNRSISTRNCNIQVPAQSSAPTPVSTYQAISSPFCRNIYNTAFELDVVRNANVLYQDIECIANIYMR